MQQSLIFSVIIGGSIECLISRGLGIITPNKLSYVLLENPETLPSDGIVGRGVKTSLLVCSPPSDELMKSAGYRHALE